MVKLDAIIDFFENHYDFDFSKIKHPIKLEPAQEITNLQTFLYSHISILKANKGNKLFMPYYDRLLKIYLIAKI